jgi:winged helix DNA-binding protein
VTTRLDLTRAQILAFRRRVQALDERLPPGPKSLRLAAWAGLTDSMPRAALLSIHARVEGTQPNTWEDPSLVQVWGLRFSAYVVPRVDVAVFTLGRFPRDEKGRRRAEETAASLDAFLAGRQLDARDAGRGLARHPNALRYGAPTGRILIRWDGARQPTVWTIPPPDVDVADARLELARRHFHVFGPATAASLGDWAGIKPAAAQAAFDGLAGSLTPVRTPIGDAWILTEDEPSFRASAPASPPQLAARLLPSGDTFYLLQGAQRELLVPEPDRRRSLWTSRVWPGAVLLGGEIVGIWRRGGRRFTIEPWRALLPAEREAVEAEAEGLPLPEAGATSVTWVG